MSWPIGSVSLKISAPPKPERKDGACCDSAGASLAQEFENFYAGRYGGRNCARLGAGLALKEKLEDSDHGTLACHTVQVRAGGRLNTRMKPNALAARYGGHPQFRPAAIMAVRPIMELKLADIERLFGRR